MHQDEMGAPHFHLRRAWPCKDEETELTTTDQTKALLKAGILPPEPDLNWDGMWRGSCRKKADGRDKTFIDWYIQKSKNL